MVSWVDASTGGWVETRSDQSSEPATDYRTGLNESVSEVFEGLTADNMLCKM